MTADTAASYEDEALATEIIAYRAGEITHKTFLKRTGKLGYQQIEALEIAKGWDDE